MDYQEYIKDQENDTIGAGVDDKYLDYLIKLLPEYNFNYKKAKVLDVGAGPFHSFTYFRDKFNNKITGIDINLASLERAKETKSGLIRMDAHEMDFTPESFDMIISFHAFEHMIDLPKVLKNCYDALKNDGYMYFSLPMPSVNFHKGHWYDVPNEEWMLFLCRQAGFRKIIHSEVAEAERFRPQQEMVCLLQK